MKKLLLTLASFLIGLTVFAGLASPVQAESKQDGNLEVIYDSPLFDPNLIWYPGLSKTAQFKVHNHDGRAHTAWVEAVNKSQTDNFADYLFVKFSKDGTVLYGENNSKTMQDFWNDGRIELDRHQPGNLFTYDMTISFDPDAGNDTQNQSLEFDLRIKFLGAGGGEVTIEGGGAGTGGTGSTEEAVAGATTTFTGLTPTVFGTQTEEPSEAESETETTVAPGEVKGATCEEAYYPWWLPLLIQGILSLAFYGFIWRKKKPKAWLLAPAVMAIISQVVHEILGCNCATGELCPWFWVFNLVIFLLPALFYWWYHQGKTDRNS